MNKTLLKSDPITTISYEGLTTELNKLVGQNVIINVVNGFSGINFLNDFSFCECKGKNTGSTLSFMSEETEASYSIHKNDILVCQKDDILGQLFIQLINGQVLHIYTEEI